MIIGGTETFARLQMSVKRTKSFAIVRTVHLHYFSSCRSVQHVLNLSCLGRYSQTRIKHYLITDTRVKFFKGALSQTLFFFLRVRGKTTNI